MAKKHSILLSTTLLAFICPEASFAQSEFIWLGSPATEAFAVSADGSVVVGTVSSSNSYVWTQVGGFTLLGDLGAPGGNFSAAYGVSSDGTTVIGYASSPSGGQAFRWTQAGGMVGLGDLAGGIFYSTARGVNADGTVVVGGGTAAGGTEAFRWTSGGGMLGLGEFAGGSFYSDAYDVSADGNTVVGTSDGTNGFEAFMWTSGSGMVGLGDLSGGLTYSEARAISADGSVIAGFSESTNGIEAFRWTSGGGMVGLGDLAGGSFFSEANDISGDGNVIVGESNSGIGFEAFRWTQATGIQSVQDWLAGAGVSLAAGWTSLSDAYGTNGDGSVVVGYGVVAFNAEAYIARVSSTGSGVITVSELAESVSGAASPAQNTNTSLNLALHGAHHRPLILDSKIERDNSYCAWGTVDGALYRNEYDGYALNQEVGLCQDFYNNSVRVGFGLGANQIYKKTARGGEQDLSGHYALTEINYAPSLKSANQTYIKGPVLGLIGVYGLWDAQVQRGYLNGGAPDISRGETDIEALSLKATAQWQNFATLDIPYNDHETRIITLSPRISYTVSRAEQDEYAETGGGFPSRFDNNVEIMREVRLALEAETKFNEDRTILRATTELTHRFDDNYGGGTGEVIGLFSFTLPEQDIKTTWGRIGLDLEHRYDNGVKVMATTFLASSGQDPDVSGALNIQIPF
jgi:probable HAF family extracellular repeat protein